MSREKQGLCGCPLPAAIALLVLATATAAGADFKEAYGEGKKAFDRQNWRELARLMERAIDENPREDRAIRIYGMAFEPYVPYYYLGVARAELGSCDAATAAWRASEEQGVIQKLKEYGDLQARRAVCLESQAQQRELEAALEATLRPGRQELDALIPAARKLLEDTSAAGISTALRGERTALREALEAASGAAAARSVAELGQLRRRLGDATTALEGAVAEYRAGEPLRRRIETLVSTGRSVLAEARQLPAAAGVEGQAQALEAAVASAAEVSAMTSAGDLQALQRLLTDNTVALRRSIDEHRAGAPVRQQIEGLVGQARAILDGAGVLPPDAGLDEESSAVRRALAAAANAASMRSTAELDGLRRELRDATAALERAVTAYERRPPPATEPETPAPPPATEPVMPTPPPDTGPPQRLRDAVRAYLGGDFERTLEYLEPVSFSDRRARLQAHLFRAAARHALFRMGGRQDQELLQAARADILACRRLDGGLEPDSEAFSPAFLSFYRDGG